MPFDIPSPFGRPSGPSKPSPTRSELIHTFYGPSGEDLLAELGNLEEIKEDEATEVQFLSNREEERRRWLETSRLAFAAAEITVDAIQPEKYERRKATAPFEARRALAEGMSAIGLPPYQHLNHMRRDLATVDPLIQRDCLILTASTYYSAGHTQDAEELYHAIPEHNDFDRMRLHAQFALADLHQHRQEGNWVETALDASRRVTANHKREASARCHPLFIELAEIAERTSANIDDLFEEYEFIFQKIRYSSLTKTAEMFFQLGCAEIAAGRFEVIDKKIAFNMGSDLQAELYAMIVEKVKATDPDKARHFLKKAQGEIERGATSRTIQRLLRAIEGLPEAAQEIATLEIVVTKDYPDESVITWKERTMAYAPLIEAYLSIGNRKKAQQLLDEVKALVEDCENAFLTIPGLPGQIPCRMTYAKALASMGEDGSAPLKRLMEMVLGPDGTLSKPFQHITIDELLLLADTQIALGIDPQPFLSVLKNFYIEQRTKEGRSFNEYLSEILAREIAWAQKRVKQTTIGIDENAV